MTAGASDDHSKGRPWSKLQQSEKTMSLRPPRNKFDDLGDALADVAIQQSFDAKLKRKLSKGRPIAVVVRVQSDEWLPFVSNVLRERFPRAGQYELSTDRKRNRQDDIVDSVAAGHPTIVLCQRGQSVAFLNVAMPNEIHLPGCTPQMLRKAAVKVVTGRAPLAFPDVTGLSLDVLRLCFVPHAHVRDAILRLESAIRTATPILTTAPHLDDLMGYDAVKRWGHNLARDLACYRAGEIEWDDVDRGCILYGPPGTGKTFIAGAIAKTCEIPIIYSSLGELFSRGDGHLGDVLKRMRGAFQSAANQAPAILFLDELDSFPSRASLKDGRDSSFWTPVITELLLLLDSPANDRRGIVVMGATNRLDAVDEALRRPGRLEQSIPVPAPNAEALVGIFKHHLPGLPVDAELQEMAVAVEGISAADAMFMARWARRIARSQKRDVTVNDLRVALGVDKRKAHDQEWTAAVHEAGHIVCGIAVGVAVGGASIGNGLVGPHTQLQLSTQPRSRRDLEKSAIVLLGGRAAEIIVFGCPTSGSSGATDSDLARATMLLASARVEFGIADQLVWQGKPQTVSGHLVLEASLQGWIEARLRHHEREALFLCRSLKTSILKVADALQTQRRLSAQEIQSLLHCGVDPETNKPN